MITVEAVTITGAKRQSQFSRWPMVYVMGNRSGDVTKVTGFPELGAPGWPPDFHY